MELMAKAGRFREVDYLAIAAQAVAALSWFHLTHDYLGCPPAGIDDERFLTPGSTCSGRT
jgi:hypothetical protein